jgi:MYXO-CTERM domain-containing protein
MKRIKKAFTAIAMSAVLFAASPVMTYAQDASTSTTTTTRDVDDADDDDDMDYGWIGLAGLLGLLGLRKRDDDRRTTTVRHDR